MIGCTAWNAPWAYPNANPETIPVTPPSTTPKMTSRAVNEKSVQNDACPTYSPSRSATSAGELIQNGSTKPDETASCHKPRSKTSTAIRVAQSTASRREDERPPRARPGSALSPVVLSSAGGGGIASFATD